MLARMKRILLLLTLVATLGLGVASPAGAESMTYWWQQNMSVSRYGVDPFSHNHTYNELYFGPNAGWKAELWEVTPAGYRHFVKSCTGNCFFSHPGYYFTKSLCANRDPNGSTHFVNDCMDRW
jgi:hypothetical protein